MAAIRIGRAGGRAGGGDWRVICTSRTWLCGLVLGRRRWTMKNRVVALLIALSKKLCSKQNKHCENKGANWARLEHSWQVIVKLYLYYAATCGWNSSKVPPKYHFGAIISGLGISS